MAPHMFQLSILFLVAVRHCVKQRLCNLSAASKLIFRDCAQGLEVLGLEWLWQKYE